MEVYLLAYLLTQIVFSLLKVRKEIHRCYALVQKLGRGVIYLGSSRVKTDHPQYLQALELAREASSEEIGTSILY